MAVSGRTVSLAVQAMLASVTGRSCGYGTAPTSASLPTGTQSPYCVLYPLGAASSGPPFGDGDGDAHILLQVTNVALTAEQAEWMADKVRVAILGRVGGGRGKYASAINAAGCAVIGRSLDKEEGIAVSSGVYSYVQRFALDVTTLAS